MSALVGRLKEIDALALRLADASGGRGSSVLLSGEAGIGKSRIVDEIAERANRMDFTIAKGAAVGSSNEPFLVFSKALECVGRPHSLRPEGWAWFDHVMAIDSAGLMLAASSSGGSGEMDPEAIGEMLNAVQGFVRDSFKGAESSLGRLEYGESKILLERTVFGTLAGIFRGDEHPDMRGSLRSICGRNDGEQPSTHCDSGLTPVSDAALKREVESLCRVRFPVRSSIEGVKLENERIRISERILAAVQECSREKPLLLILEDMHWADESSLFALRYLIRNISQLRIFLLWTSRPPEEKVPIDGMPFWGKEGGFTEITLSGMSLADASNLTTSLFPENDFPPDFPDRLLRDCAGNPFFMKELLRQMNDEGAITLRNGRCVLARGDYTVPPSIDALVDRRLGSLDPDAMALAEFTSCMGREFPAEAILKSTSLDSPESSLRKLTSAGIIRFEGGRGEFSHALFQSAVYRSLAPRWRATHHRSIGAYLETVYVGREDAIIYELARHFVAAGDGAKAFTYASRAASKAESLFAVEAALNFYDDALAALSRMSAPPSDRRRMEILERIGDLQSLTGKYDGAIDSYMKVKDALKDGLTRARMLRKAGNAQTNKGDFDKSLEMLNSARIELEPANSQELGRILTGEGAAYVHKGELDKAKDLLNEALRTMQNAEGSNEDQANALRMIGSVYQNKGDYDAALDCQEKCLAIAEKAGGDYDTAAALHNIGVVLYHWGDMDKALDYYDRSLKIKRKIGDRQGVAMSLNTSGLVHWNKGDHGKALETYDQAMKILEKIGDKRSMGLSLSNIGAVHYDMGELDTALHYYTRGLEILEKIGNTQNAATILMNIGLLHADRGEFKEALAYHIRSLETRKKIGDKPGIAMSLNNIASMYFDMGEYDKALESLENGLKISLEIGETRLSIHEYIGIAEIKQQTGDLQNGHSYAQKALVKAVEIGARSEEGMCHRVLGTLNLREGKFDESNEEYLKAKAIFEEIQDNMELATLIYEYALYFKALGDHPKAREYLGRAQAEFERMKLAQWVARCRRAAEEMDCRSPGS